MNNVNNNKIILPLDFNWRTYLKLNNDLKDFDKRKAIEHYLRHGVHEKRKYKYENFVTNNNLNIYPAYTSSYYKNIFYENIPINFDLTVIIINYNNSKYLIKRLDSVYKQTILPTEVIIIDDCSTDNSIELIEDYIKDKKVNTKLIKNETNLGSGYFNWIKGIEESKTEFIWIAEADDYCELNFIETLLPKFIDLSVSLCYCKTIFINDNYSEVGDITNYLNNKWGKNFVKSNSFLLKHYWSYLNIIPNVSSCIFRKPTENVLKNVKKFLDIYKLELVVDWLFYLLITKNSSISYSVDTKSYYLIHDDSVSKKIQKSFKYLEEHLFIIKFITESFNINRISIDLLNNELIKHCNNNNIELQQLKSIFDPMKIYKRVKNDIKTVLIFSFGFLLGGGETFPIYLANGLYKKNINVVFMTNPENNINIQIFNLLDKNIKIVNNVSKLEKIIDEFNITHVNTHHHYCDDLILDFNTKKKVKHYITDHGMYNINEENTINLMDKIMQETPNIICINDKNFNKFKVFNSTIYSIPICIPDYNIEKINRIDFGLLESDFVITLASRCIEEKGWKDMIEIMDSINLEHKHVKLLLVGDYNNEYGINLMTNCSNKNVYFLGFHDKIKRFYDISDIGILPTFYQGESNPIVLIECLYANKPFISSKVGDIAKMLYGNKDYAGSVIDLDKNNKINKKEYISELKKYITDKKYYESKLKQVEYARRQFLFEKIVNRYINAFFD